MSERHTLLLLAQNNTLFLNVGKNNYTLSGTTEQGTPGGLVPPSPMFMKF